MHVMASVMVDEKKAPIAGVQQHVHLYCTRCILFFIDTHSYMDELQSMWSTVFFLQNVCTVYLHFQSEDVRLVFIPTLLTQIFFFIKKRAIHEKLHFVVRQLLCGWMKLCMKRAFWFKKLKIFLLTCISSGLKS